jgi:hypothetical protein
MRVYARRVRRQGTLRSLAPIGSSYPIAEMQMQLKARGHHGPVLFDAGRVPYPGTFSPDM